MDTASSNLHPHDRRSRLGLPLRFVPVPQEIAQALESVGALENHIAHFGQPDRELNS